MVTSLTEDQNKVEIIRTSKDLVELKAKIELLDDVYDGNPSISGIDKYLFKYDKETELQFDNRVKRSVFYNFLKPKIKTLADKPFSSDVTLDEKLPDDFKFVLNDVDNKGNGILTVAHNAMSFTLRHGCVGLFVDNDTKLDNPFVKLINCNDLLGVWGKLRSDGQYLFEKVRFITKLIEAPTDENSNEILKMKIIELIHPNIVREYAVQGDKTSDDTYKVNLIREKILKGFEKLPFYLFTAEEPLRSESLFSFTPPFFDLAKINILHFNKKSDHDGVMAVSRYAVLAVTGVNKDELDFKTKIIGPHTLLYATSPNAKFYYVEHSGAALTKSFEDLTKEEKAMMAISSDYGKKVQFETATEKSIDEQEKNTFIFHLVTELQKTFSNIIRDFAIYKTMVLPEDIKDSNLVSFVKDTSERNSALIADSLHKAKSMGDIQPITYLEGLKSIGVFSESFDAGVEVEAVEAERAISGGDDPFLNASNDKDKEQDDENEDE